MGPFESAMFGSDRLCDAFRTSVQANTRSDFECLIVLATDFCQGDLWLEKF